MKFEIIHKFPLKCEDLIHATFEKNITEKLKGEMKTILDAETILWQRNGNIIKRKVRYLPYPAIKNIGPKKVDPKWMEWIEESEVDLEKMEVNFKNIPTISAIANLLKNSGKMRFEPDSEGARRIISGELKINVFILGVIAERLIFHYAKKILDEEVGVMKKYLVQKGGKNE